MSVELPSTDELADDLEAFEAPITTQSDFDTPYAAIARRSMRKAQLLDANPEIAQALDKLLAAIVIYCQIHDTRPEDLDVDSAMSFEGRIVTSIRRR